MSAVRRDWRSAVDRRLFIPDVIWRYPGDGRQLEPLDRVQDPEGWEREVASEDPVIVQVDDGQLGKWGVIYPTCSSTALWLMERMVDALDLAPGMSVLEIGTGTGYNAAVLAELGARVVSVEIDEHLAETARASLRRAGYADWVTVLTGDGEFGAPDFAPFDRVIATAAAHTVPSAWVRQCREGGRIVAPYSGEYGQGALLLLDVCDGHAVGHAAGDAYFMPLRGQRLSQAEIQALPELPDELRVEITPGGEQRFTVAKSRGVRAS